jgi:CRP-like cAMP-binding protein
LFFTEDEEVKGIFFINKGKAKVHKQWGDKELIVRFAGQGDIVGHRGLGKKKFILFLQQLSSGRLYVSSILIFLKLLLE